MLRAIAHRGPDGQGLWQRDSLALGHVRLAIVDLTEDASQPMTAGDGRFAISFNGMIYNYRELRETLVGLGHVFRSVSDTEVLLHSLMEWGTDAISRLNGMFAFAFVDTQTKTTVLARDRYGIKPLYYTRENDEFIFSSEIKAILAARNGATELDEKGLLEYFTFQNFLSERTLFRHISTFPPGHYATVSDQGLTMHRFWDFSFEEDRSLAAKSREVEEEVARLFQQAVIRQLASDVPVGSFLSGGIDSGSVSSIAASHYNGLKTFTVGFETHAGTGLESGFLDERAAAEYIASIIDSEHYEIVLKSGDMVRALPHIVHHLEEPRVGQSYPNYYASKLASLAVKVALSGAGGDELFGGYPWRYYRAAVNDSFDTYVDKYYTYWQRLIPNRLIQQVFHPIWPHVRETRTRDIFESVLHGHRNEPPETPEQYVNLSLYFEAKTFLHGLLIVDDKLAMAHGLEQRVPFLDNDLVDFAMRVPLSLKLANLGDVVRLNENDPGPKTQKYFEQTHDGKMILREVMRRFVPDEVATGIKRGFSGPDGSWFRGPSIDFVRKTLLASNARMYNFFDRAATSALVEEHLSGRENRRLLIWSLLNFELWCREFLG